MTADEIAEAGAPPGIAALYGEIAATVGMVNLIYRRMAALPGALDGCWAALRPGFADGAIDAAAARAEAGLALPAGAPLPAAALEAAGLDAAAVVAVTTVIDRYNQGNRRNLIGMTALLRMLRDGAGAPGGGRAPAGSAVPPAPPPLPPLPDLAALPAGTVALIHHLNRFGEPAAPLLVASLWRHLGPWPGFLALAAAQLAAIDGAGLLQPALDRLRASAAAEAAAIAATLPRPALALAEDARERLVRDLETFSGRMILKMVPIGTLLRQLLP